MTKHLTLLLFIGLAWGQTTIAVFEFENNGLESYEVKQLSTRLESELVKLSKYDVVERTKIDEILKEQKLQMSGCVEECLIDVGKMLGAKQIILGSVGKLDSIYSITAKMLDATTGKILKTSDFDSYDGIVGLATIGMKQIALELAGKKTNVVNQTVNRKINTNSKTVEPSALLEIERLKKQLELAESKSNTEKKEMGKAFKKSNLFLGGKFDYSDSYYDKDAPKTSEGTWQRDEYFKANFAHIMLDFDRGKEELVPFVELYKYWSYIHFHKDGGETYFEFFDFEDDGVNELIMGGSYMTAGYSGYFHIFEKIGDSNIYKIVLDFDSSGMFGLNANSKLFYSIHQKVDYIICGACGHQHSKYYSQKSLNYHNIQKGESNREYKKRTEREPVTKFVSLYPNYFLETPVYISYKNGELFHPKQTFAKNTEYLDVMTFIKDEINSERIKKVETRSILSDWSDWYRPLIMNIMAYHYNSMQTGTYPDDKINLKNTKRTFYDVYQAHDVDERWEELLSLLKLYPYKKL